MVPVRDPPLLADTLKPTVPLPLPDDPDVIVIQDALLTAVQGQPPAEDTATVPVPAAGPRD
jgi:hypothetical protein